MKLLLPLFATLLPLVLANAASVSLGETPQRGLQPRLFVDDEGVVHALWYKGDARSGDVFHATQNTDKKTWSRAVRVNSEAESAIAAGTIRGAQVAQGRNGHIHVVWNGSGAKLPKGEHPPMFYTRSTDGGKTFEPQRVISGDWPLDGGGAVAADAQGKVHVFWHAGRAMGKGTEIARRVYVRTSEDDGKSFGAEHAASPDGLGVCACCAMQALATRDGNHVYVLFRSAFDNGTSRHIVSLVSQDQGKTFAHTIVAKWTLSACPMSSMALAETEDGVLGAWETAGQVYVGQFESGAGMPQIVASPEGQAGARKHPVLAVDQTGEVLLAWAEGTGWEKGGSLGWQTFDRYLKPTIAKGSTTGVPVWSFSGATATAEGFLVVK